MVSPGASRPRVPAELGVDALVIGLVIGLALLFYRAILFTQDIAADPLLVRLVYPYRQFLADALRDGRLPLWNPYQFTGVPFLADPRAGAWYPPNLVLRWLDAPQAFAATVVGHAALAALGTYLFARVSLRLVRPAAFTAGVVFAFGGFMGANAVEPNVVEAAAWLPLVLLGTDLAARRHLLLGVVTAAAALAMQALAGQPQVSVLTVLAMAALLAMRPARSAPSATRTRRAAVLRVAAPAGRSVVVLVGVLALATGLAAAQLLPTRELLGQSVRAGGPSVADAAGALRPRGVVRALLPGFNENPLRLWTAHVGIIPLGLAVLALRRRSGAALFGGALAAMGLLIALGDSTPAYRLLGGRLGFEHPTRALLLVAFGGAVAAGAGVHALWPGAERRRAARGWVGWLWTVLGLALVGGAAALILVYREQIDLPSAGVREIWLGLGIIALDIALVLPLARPRRWVALLIALAAAAELMVAGARLPFTVTAPRAAFEVEPALAAMLRSGAEPARLARISGFAEADAPPAAGFDRYMAARAGRDRLAPASGMLDRVATLEGLRTELVPRSIIDALTVDGPTSPATVSALLTLGALPAESATVVARRLGADYLLGPPRAVVRAGAAEFVLGAAVPVPPGGAVQLDLQPQRPATAVALLTDLRGGPADGVAAAEVVLTEADGTERLRTLVAGVDTADAGAPGQPGAVALGEAGTAFLSEQPLGRAAAYRRITVRNRTERGTLRIYAVTLLDERTGGSTPVVLDERLRAVAGTEPALYQLTGPARRAELVRRVAVDAGFTATPATLAALAEGTTVLDRPPVPAIDGSAPPGGVDRVAIELYTPERVELAVTAAAPGVLVLRDTAYPGWRARVDGEPVALMRADGLFRAVAVPAGAHRVVFEFSPESVRRGASLSRATLGLTVAVLLVWTIQRAVRSRLHALPRQPGA